MYGLRYNIWYEHSTLTSHIQYIVDIQTLGNS